MTILNTHSTINAFASTAPGLEPVVMHELSMWSINGTQTAGGVEFDCEFNFFIDLARMLRSPSRLLLRLNHGLLRKLSDLHALLNESALLQLLPKGCNFEVHVSTQRSLLRTDILKSKAKRMLKAMLKGPTKYGSTQHVFIRVSGDKADLSIDPIGELRHKRGWRLEQGKAPLRENWAASLLLMAGWSPQEPLIDPFCGSGTIPIEAALMAAAKSPFVHFTAAHDAWIVKMKPSSLSYQNQIAPFIQGRDHHHESLNWAKGNAKRANVDCDWVLSDVSDLQCELLNGLVISNPPYGKRIGQNVQKCYRQLGHSLRNELPSWRALFLSPNERLARLVDKRVKCLCTFKNGGQRVGVWILEPAE